MAGKKWQINRCNLTAEQWREGLSRAGCKGGYNATLIDGQWGDWAKEREQKWKRGEEWAQETVKNLVQVQEHSAPPASPNIKFVSAGLLHEHDEGSNEILAAYNNDNHAECCQICRVVNLDCECEKESSSQKCDKASRLKTRRRSC